MKRMLDIGFTLLFLVVCAPAMLLIVVLMLLTDGRPLLYRSLRIGLHGVPFLMLKFRSMHTDGDQRLSAEQREALQQDFKLPDDPRITSVGRWLRRTSLDELPQLFHVLRGEMSLVGPRPKLPEELHLFDASTGELLSVRPGVTGYWQVFRTSAASDEMMRTMDLRYIRTRTLWMDLGLLARTPWVALKGRNG